MKLTKEQEIIVDCWFQFAYIGKRGKNDVYYAGGLSTLEAIEWYLRKEGIITRNGTLKRGYKF